MHRKKRTHLQIVSDILEKCIKPQNKTSIMYQSNLSYTMMTSYLLELQQAKLLEVSFYSEKEYAITARGREYLEKYRALQKIVDLSAPDDF